MLLVFRAHNVCKYTEAQHPSKLPDGLFLEISLDASTLPASTDAMPRLELDYPALS